MGNLRDIDMVSKGRIRGEIQPVIAYWDKGVGYERDHRHDDWKLDAVK